MELPVKSYTTLIVVAVAVVVCVAVGIFTAYPLESAQTRLDRQVSQQVDIAQRMLLDYRPIETQLAARLGSATTQPVDVPPDRWQEALGSLQSGSLGQQFAAVGSRVHQLNNRFNQATGESAPPPGPPASGMEAYRAIQAALNYNEKLLDDALKIVQQAIAMSEGERTGADHPGATRLESVLCYHRADQLRRQAAIQRAEADDAQARLMQQATWWQRLIGDMTVTNRELGIAGDAAASAPAGWPPIDDRIAQLQKHKEEILATGQQAQAEVDRLTQVIKDLEARIAVASGKAADTEQRMLELQQKGADPTDPGALKRFADSYEQIAAANRAAWREATILKQGSLRNARVDSADEDEILSRPLSPSEGNGEIATERGLVALQSDLKAVEAVAHGHKAIAAEIDRQIGRLTDRKKDMTRRAEALKASQSQSAEELAQFVKTVLTARMEALRLEKEGVEMARNRGLQAAQRAKRAVEKRISEAQQTLSAQGGESQNQRLLLISADKAGPGNAIAMIGDLHLLAAQLQAQQAANLEAHARLLDELGRLHITIDAKMLPEGMTLESVPAEAIKVDGARTAAEQAHAAALEAAGEALKAYAEADTLLQQLWVLHANMATAHHLMANLTSGPDSEKHAEEARIEYLRAMKGREERPEVPLLQSAVASLAAATRPVD